VYNKGYKQLYAPFIMTEKLMSKTDTITRPKIAPRTALVEPPEFRVIYVNDDVTTQEFVIETLKIVFDYNEQDAYELTMKVHEEKSAVVAVLPFEIAEQKGIEVTMMARAHGFPLLVKIEQET
jgi:ATP-dependent Clp protease adaptor protein ClpS